MDEPKPASARDKPRIFVMEDEFLFAAMLMYMLAQLGFDCVGPTGNRQEAVTIAREQPLDAAIIGVPLEGATEVAAILTERKIPFGVVVLSDKIPLSGSLAGARRILKPYDLADVQLLLVELLPVRHGPA